MREIVVFVFSLVLLLMLPGCGGQEDGPPDSFHSGTIHISCDETFKPVIDEHIRVYMADFPDTKIIVHYKPEAECLMDLYNDTIRMVIATRGFNNSEKAGILDSTGVGPQMFTVARDAIAVIVHPQARDSFFTVQEIKDLIIGKLKKDLIPVFDGLSATSTVRFMLDSVLNGQSLGSNVTAAPSTQEVVEYVSKVKNAVGFVGVSWVGNQEDSTQKSFMNKIRIARLESTDSAGFYVKPVQMLIYTGSYPLIRDLIYVVKEKHQGLGKAFGYFLQSQRGQLIFRRAYLQPVKWPSYIRSAELEEEY